MSKDNVAKEFVEIKGGGMLQLMAKPISMLLIGLILGVLASTLLISSDIEIVFVLPYSMDEVQEWSTLFPHQMQVIESWKNPKDPASLSEGQKRFSREVRELLPHQFSYVAGEEPPLPFPVVVDANRTLAKRMGLFTTEWEGSKADQMVPTVFLLDESAVVQFKYYSQSSLDRPHPTYLKTYLTKIMSDK